MTPASADFLAQLPEVVAAHVKAVLPDLATCRGIAGRLNLDALKLKGYAAPAVLVSRLRLVQGQVYSGGLTSYTLSMAAFVVTRDELAQRRDLAEGVITQALLTLVPSHTWGLGAHLGGADQVAAEPLITLESEKAGVALAAITWAHQVGFGPVPPVSTIEPALYVAGSIRAGEERRGDYQLIGGAP
jgi:hypothetical protein